jgi:hypothetical protein
MTTTYGNHLLPQHAALLEASGIPVDVARERGYRSVDTKVQLKKFGFGEAQRRVPALLIPIRDVRGDYMTMQIRPDSPREKNGRELKYETPTGSGLVIDLPPRARPWIGDPTRPLFITEGARKADAAVARGLCCVALMGVYGWRGKNEHGGTTALADWEMIALKGRDVYVAFDSDVTINPSVADALTRLAGFLSRRGATPRVIYLPAGEGGVKTGLDDYLAAGHGVLDLLAHARDELPKPADSKQKREPRGEAVPVAQLLDEVLRFERRFVVEGDEEVDATALWVLHTWAFDAASATPYLHITSPDKESGKTRKLEVLELITRKPWLVSRATAAVLARKVAAERPTLLYDEMDATLQGDKEFAETLRGLLNSGYRDSGRVSVCVGQGADISYVDLPTFCPKAIAGIGALPDTVASRCIEIRLSRRTRRERGERFRVRKLRDDVDLLRGRLVRFADDHTTALALAEPHIPDELSDRQADVWEPLFAIADLAGGEWPERARRAAVTLAARGSDGEESIRSRLLAAVKAVFDADGGDAVFTTRLIEGIAERDDEFSTWWHPPSDDKEGKPAPWATRELGRLLRPFDIRSRSLRVGTRTAKGYRRDAFEEAWNRYLPPSPPENAVTSVTLGCQSQK